MIICSYAGTTVFAEIQGVIEACVRLTGMPDLTLSFMVNFCICIFSWHQFVHLSKCNIHLLLSFGNRIPVF